MSCNKDCLNCELPQCIHDKGARGRGANNKTDGKFSWDNYYERNKKRLQAKSRERYQEKRDEILAYQRKYRQEHREEWRKGGKYYDNGRKG